jgi:AAA domain
MSESNLQVVEFDDCPNAVDAVYLEQTIPRFRGNELIEALPKSLAEEELVELLTLPLEFEPEQRALPTNERILLLMDLTNFMVPMESHIKLATVLDAMVRQGYVGRRPMSKEHIGIYQEIYRKQQAGETFRQSASTITPQLSVALIGLSGMGKTTTVKRVLARYPKVIRHRKLGLYQVPWLHVEMTSDGKSVKGLAAGILKALDQRLPRARYYRDYFGSGKVSADALLRSVAMLMNKHMVGLLVVDEVQNLANSPKGQQTVMAELVSACNELQVPILFIGTNRAQKVLGLDFRQARRSLGLGVGDWSNLPKHDENGQPGEWAELMAVMWRYQWTRTPVELSERMLGIFYDCTQGVIDLAIKLHAAAQVRAMVDGSEQLTEELVLDVFAKDMKLVHKMVQAMQQADLTALAQFEDIAPLGLDEIVENMARRYRGPRTFTTSVRPGEPDFVPRLATAGISLGMDPEAAARLAREVEDEGKAKNMVDAAKQLAAKLTPPRRLPSTKAANDTAVVDWSSRPKDYRRATHSALAAGSSVMEQLIAMGMARPVEEHFCL